MHITRYLRPLLVAVAVIGASGPHIARAAPQNHGDGSEGSVLYVGDAGDNSVKRFDAEGYYLGAFVPPGGGLAGPRGMLKEGTLLVANQNVGQSFAGEIDQYARKDGTFLGALVPNSDPNGPFAPRGIIRGEEDHTLYVADLGNGAIGRVATFDVKTGQFQGNLDFSSFIGSTGNTTGEFHPRGVVFGPDGLLYVSLFSEVNPVLGWILSYNSHTGAVRVVAAYNPGAGDCTRDLHRPEGLTFGPDGNLYVTSFRSGAGDTDKILTFNAATGACLSSIVLDQANQPRAFAQALLFGPGGALFVPISGNGTETGAVRKYDVGQKTFVYFVKPGGPLQAGWYLTFAHTNPHTLAYTE